MNIPYHSRFYGWTYYWINFLLAAPAYMLTTLKVFQGHYFFLISIRFILFLIGLASLLAFFEVAKQFLKHNLLAFLASLLYVASPTISNFFYFIHPETTGLLFLFLGLLCLHKFHEAPAEDLRWYTFALLSLTLSILSKHVFVFTAIPVFFLFLYIYSHHHQISIFRFVLSKKFGLILLGSLIFSAFIFFVINPFAFFQPGIFFTNQLRLFTTQTQGSLTEFEAIKAWLDILWKMPVIWISIILSPLSLLGATLFSDQRVGKMVYLANLIGATFFILFSVNTLRYIRHYW